MDILLCFDDKSCPQAAVTMLSAIENINAQINFHILHSNISLKNKFFLSLFILSKGNFKSTIQFYEVPEEEYNKLPVPEEHYLPKETYLRLLAAQYLPATINRILYVDTDILFIGDVSDLGQLEIDDYALAATYAWPKFSKEKKLSLGMPSENQYYQGGVLVINLNRWRKDNAFQKMKKFISESKPGTIECHDQDLINAIYYNCIKTLPLKYNIAVHLYANPDSEFIWGVPLAFSVKEVHEAFDDPKIYHYGGKAENKPWHPDCYVPQGGIYL